MLRALIAGTRDPETLAELARGTLRRKIPALRQALHGRFGPHHALLVGTILAKLEFLDEALGHLSAEIEQVIAPFAAEAALLRTIRELTAAPRSRRRRDRCRHEPLWRGGRLASWAGWCPGNNESAGRHGSARPQGLEVAPHLSHRGGQSSRQDEGHLPRRPYARLRGRRGSARATVAVGHSILVAAYHILDRHEPYRELGPDYFRRRHSPEHQTQRLVRQIEALGYHVRLEEVA